MIRFRVALKHSIKIGIVGLALSTMGFAMAQTKAEKAIKYRQSVMQVVSWNFGPIAGMSKGKLKFNAEKFAKNAKRLSMMLPMAEEGFIKDSYTGKTTALPKIGTDMDGFKQKLMDAINASKKLAKVAKSGDEAAMKEQGKATGKTCGGCHKKYRKKKKK